MRNYFKSLALCAVVFISFSIAGQAQGTHKQKRSAANPLNAAKNIEITYEIGENLLLEPVVKVKARSKRADYVYMNIKFEVKYYAANGAYLGGEIVAPPNANCNNQVCPIRFTVHALDGTKTIGVTVAAADAVHTD